MKKKILFVNPCADIGGAEMSMLLLLAGLAKKNYDLSLILPEDGLVADRAKALGVKVHIFPMRPLMIEQNIKQSIQDALTAVKQINAIRKLLANINPQIIHINSYRVGLTFTWASRSLGIPSVWHFRDIPSSPIKQKLIANLAKFPTKSIAISNAVFQVLNSRGTKNMQIVYNGVNVEQFNQVTPKLFRQEMNLPSDAILLCSIGQLIPWKGHDFLIKAFAQLTENQKKYLIIVGGNVSPVWKMPDANRDFGIRLQELVKNYGIEEKVLFTGFRSDIPQILSDIDIYVHSATSPEPFGRVLIEAMAAKKPIVAPNWGGIPEIVGDGLTGLLYKPNNLASLKNTLVDIMKIRPKWEQMGEAGCKMVHEKFTVVQHVANMQQVYEQILQV